jgi:hypothetical protein
MSLFDAIVIVDWSANNTPKVGKDSIWVAATGGVLKNPKTRHEARDLLQSLLVTHVRAERRVLVGFDFGYGYPSGFSDALCLNGAPSPWRRTWEYLRRFVLDDSANQNNRFQAAAVINERCGRPPGPFWACPAARLTAALKPTKPKFPFDTKDRSLSEYRHTEQALHRRGSQVHSVWKLYTAGSVGGQVLTGIPVVAALRDDPALAPFSKVWPFETGFSEGVCPDKGPYVLHAEIWPGIVTPKPEAHEVRDAAQVLTLMEHLAGLDRQGKLEDLFKAPKALGPAALQNCLDEEGWILGA